MDAFELRDFFTRWEADYRLLFQIKGEPCLSCSKRVTKEQCLLEESKSSCQWDEKNATCGVPTSTSDIRIVLDEIRNAHVPRYHQNEKFSRAPYTALLLDLVPESFRQTSDIGQHLYRLPVFIQAQLLFVYLQLDPKITKDLLSLLHRKIFSYAESETWEMRLRVLQTIIDYHNKPKPFASQKPRIAPTTNRQHGLLMAVMGFLLLQPSGATPETSVVSMTPSDAQNHLATIQRRMGLVQSSLVDHVAPVLLSLQTIDHSPLKSRLEFVDGKQNYLEIIDNHLQSFLANTLKDLEEQQFPSPFWSMFSDTVLYQENVEKLLREFPVNKGIFVTDEVYSTLQRLLPSIQKSFDATFNDKLDADEQEDFLVLWIATLKIIECTTKQQNNIPAIAHDSRYVENLYDSFLRRDETPPRKGRGPPKTETSPVQWARRYERIRMAANGLIDSVNTNTVFRKELEDVRAKLRAAQESYADQIAGGVNNILDVCTVPLVRLGLLLMVIGFGTGILRKWILDSTPTFKVGGRWFGLGWIRTGDDHDNFHQCTTCNRTMPMYEADEHQVWHDSDSHRLVEEFKKVQWTEHTPNTSTPTTTPPPVRRSPRLAIHSTSS